MIRVKTLSSWSKQDALAVTMVRNFRAESIKAPSYVKVAGFTTAWGQQLMTPISGFTKFLVIK